MTNFKALLKRFLSSTDGATAIEYGLLVAGIALVIVPSVGALAPLVNIPFDAMANALDSF